MKFGKLFKHEFKQSFRLALPVYLGIIIMGFVACLSAVVFDRTVISGNGNEDLAGFAGMSSMGTLALSLTAVGAGVVGAWILNAVRFLRTMTGQQSYLTHTLPVTADGLLMSKILCALLVLLGAVIAAGIAVFCVVMTFLVLESTTPIRDLIDAVYSLVKALTDVENLSALSVIWSTLGRVVMLALGMPMLLFTAIMAAGSLVQKRKGLLGAGLFLGASAVLNFISSLAAGLISFLFVNSQDVYETMMVSSSMVNIFLYLIVIVAGYFFMRWIITRKLNVNA